ncbi:hypothetical protein JOB18_043251 [Solea senegalensis]|uniref:Uncharacterized protein n=1 Tax=Solea senegalensis TaxID=28829 RepID=A0AAV6Q2M6_SOLSE|nr:hypothetical protein JOB18_043251 [Solea senegalensis]
MRSTDKGLKMFAQQQEKRLPLPLSHTHTPSRILGKSVSCAVKGCGEGSGTTARAAINQSPPN